jgi:hypothetical protein
MGSGLGALQFNSSILANQPVRAGTAEVQPGVKDEPELVHYIFGSDFVGGASKGFLFAPVSHLFADIALFSLAGQAFGD